MVAKNGCQDTDFIIIFMLFGNGKYTPITISVYMTSFVFEFMQDNYKDILQEKVEQGTYGINTKSLP